MSKIFADNLRYLMAANGIKNVNQLSNLTGVPQPTIFRWLAEGSRQPRYESLLPVTEFFRVSFDDILTRNLSEEGDPETRKDTLRNTIPLIPMERAADFQTYINNRALGKSWPALKSQPSTRAFAVVVKGNAMAHEIPSGAIVIMEPCDSYSSEDIVLALPPDSSSPVLRRLEQDGAVTYLMPNVKGFEVIKLTTEPRIIAKVIEVQVISTPTDPPPPDYLHNR